MTTPTAPTDTPKTLACRLAMSMTEDAVHFVVSYQRAGVMTIAAAEGISFDRLRDDFMASFDIPTAAASAASLATTPKPDYSILEDVLDALVRYCNNDDMLCNASEVIAAEAALETLYKARLAQQEHCQCPACIGGATHASDCAVHGIDTAAGIVKGSCDCMPHTQDQDFEHFLSYAGFSSDPAEMIAKLRRAFDAGTPAASLVAEPEKPACHTNVQLAYGYLWHVNNEPGTPAPMYSPEKAAYKARHYLSALMTHEERGIAINAVRGLLGGSDV